jgi:hypothetical protein
MEYVLKSASAAAASVANSSLVKVAPPDCWARSLAPCALLTRGASRSSRRK